MDLLLDEAQRDTWMRYRRMADELLLPHAAGWDAEERLPVELIQSLAGQGLLSARLPQSVGGLGLDALSFGLLCEAVGGACSSVRSLLTVHDMVAHAVMRWGSTASRARWLAPLVRGELLGALAFSEPGHGSDLASVETRAEWTGAGWQISGAKHWITFAQRAGLFLVLARAGGQLVTFLVERGTPGLSVQPTRGVMGVRASMLGTVYLDGCEVDADCMVGRPGFGLSAVGATALDRGRYSVAWGCAGTARACLGASLQHVRSRRQFGTLLADHQLVRALLTDAAVDVREAQLHCWYAARAIEARSLDAAHETAIAKYRAARAASAVASAAVQLHGAVGFGPTAVVQRHFRDTKVMEIIEGSNQMHQINIAGALLGTQPASVASGTER